MQQTLCYAAADLAGGKESACVAGTTCLHGER